MHQLSMPEEDSTWGIANITTILAIRKKNSRHLCPLHLEIGVAKVDTTQSNTGWNKAFTHIQKRHIRARSAPIVCMSSHGQRISPGSQHRAVCLCAPLSYCSSRIPTTPSSPHPVESKILKVGGMTEAHRYTCLCRTKENSLRLKQKKIYSYKVTSLEQAVWALYFLRSKSSRPKPIFMQLSEGQKTVHMRLPFPIWNFVRYCQNAFQQFCVNLYPH